MAAGVEAAAHLVRGNYKAAAAAAVGVIPGGKYVGTAFKLASKVGKVGKKQKEFKSTLALGNKAHKKFERHITKKRFGGTPATKYLQCGSRKCKPDGYNRYGGPIELKPHNRAAIARGKTQLRKYEVARKMPGELWTYRKTWYGRIKFSRIS
ncbi:hypothetical protein LG315_00210 [Microbacterium marinum]|uniref:hypothetical protein n=1 Tax=Microbacterium marinum TaxID=421115 RepID=UPI00384E7DF7